MNDSALKENPRPNGITAESRRRPARPARAEARRTPEQKIRVFVAAENRLLREALARVLNKRGSIEVIATDAAAPFPAIKQVRTSAPNVSILLIGMAKDEREFLQCVRAGISGYLLRDASADEVLEGVHAVFAGEAVCPGVLCSVLFRYFESDAASLPYASGGRRMGLSRREQQLIPLVAQGLTNKEIANHFSLSEQTVKNHLYRMKHKIGAEDRLEMVQLYRTHGFLV